MQYKVVLISGASSGIGEAIARNFLARGAIVHGLGRDSRRLLEAKKRLPKKHQKNFHTYRCDVAISSGVKTALRKIFKKCSPDLIINNAGVGFSNDIMEYTDEQIESVIDTNLKGTVYITRESLKLRDRNKPLQLVNVSSLGGKMGFPHLSIYSASKFAVEGFTEAMQRDYDSKNVYFTILRPGITDTDFFNKAGMENFRNSVKKLKSFYTAESVAEEFVNKLDINKLEITIGNDRVFLKLSPFIPFKRKFQVLDIVNKLQGERSG